MTSISVLQLQLVFHSSSSYKFSTGKDARQGPDGAALQAEKKCCTMGALLQMLVCCLVRLQS